MVTDAIGTSFPDRVCYHSMEANRAATDVSEVAGTRLQVGGTSASSPIIAATYGLAGGITGNAASYSLDGLYQGCLFPLGRQAYNYQMGSDASVAIVVL